MHCAHFLNIPGSEVAVDMAIGLAGGIVVGVVVWRRGVAVDVPAKRQGVAAGVAVSERGVAVGVPVSATGVVYWLTPVISATSHRPLAFDRRGTTHRKNIFVLKATNYKV